MRLILCLAFTLVAPAISLAATISYSFEKLEFGSRVSLNALNNRGWIAGSVYDASGESYPFRYRPGIGGEQLSNIRGVGTDINDAGTIVGSLSRGEQGIAFVRPAGQPWTDIGTLGGRSSIAWSISASGHVAGMARTSDRQTHAFLYTPATGMTDLGTLGGISSVAYAVNESGQVLGRSRLAGTGSHMFLYDPGLGMIDIGSRIGEFFYATALNDNGVIAGSTRRGVVLYSLAGGLRKLGTLDGGYSASPDAINNRGWVVGSSAELGNPDPRAFLYVPGSGMRDLNTLVPGLDAVLNYTIDINDRGQILAESRVGSQRTYYLLSRTREVSALDAVATPEPSTWALMAVGLVGMGIVRRRR